MVSVSQAGASRRPRPRTVTQEQIVLGLAVILAIILVGLLPSFRSGHNLLSIAQNTSVEATLGVGMAIVVIARGIDLSQVAIMVVTSAETIQLLQHHGTSQLVAVLAGLGIAIALGVFNGFLVAFVEIPALFATLGTFFLYLNGAQAWFLPNQIVSVHSNASFIEYLGAGRPLGIPMPLIVFVAVALLAHIFLSKLSIGRFLYAHGDNTEAAGITGIAIRPLTMLEYVLCALIGFVAGLVQAGTISEMDTQIALGNLIFTVILIVVIGGISLVGGRGTVFSVVVGALLIGIFTNGMTLLNFTTNDQSIVLGVILLGAIILDNRLHPRDEETAKQGD